MGLFATVACAAVVAAGSAAAQTRTVRIPSKILGEERVVHVNLPPNYTFARRRYEVVYLLDGHVRQFFDITVAAAGYDVIGDAHDYAMPPQIVVGSIRSIAAWTWAGTRSSSRDSSSKRRFRTSIGSIRTNRTEH